MKRRQTTTEVAIVESFGRALWALLKWPFRGRQKRFSEEDRSQLRIQWEQLYASSGLESSASRKVALIEADALFDRALKHCGLEGQTMADRLRSAQRRWGERFDDVWEAHRLRNQVVHEAHPHISVDQLTHVLNSYAQALRQIGAL